MKFHTDFPIPRANFNVQIKDDLLFIGSCFSDDISVKAENSGFKVSANPFGTIFHPLAISRFIEEILEENKPGERIVQRNDMFFSWDASGQLYGLNRVDLEEKLSEIRLEWESKIKSSKVLFITFGTAWGYVHTEYNLVVANCHKQPQLCFLKELSTTEDITSSWIPVIRKLQKINPELQIVFTVSPVRHTRDGLIQNNQSKAVLIEVVRVLNEMDRVSYFPSYEIVMDELRDYRFFKEDRIHPNDEAISYIWDRFKQTYCTVEEIELMQEIEGVRSMVSHKILYPESKENEVFQEQLTRKKTSIHERFPWVKL